ncbi:hypothetical protein [Corynebacterium pseudodiphtheriticum]|uniref:hypothetical protein n=1 Tax=Corynebacterium pseudodiphtheriticum TaxID=37637 RepID=UPI0025417BBB|nr:hypothetical protein [Corynebacterium pseudodiphtheriticum]MDK4321183.1 hypothetical protein [Corynebacterium pseudodiphtheriticum]
MYTSTDERQRRTTNFSQASTTSNGTTTLPRRAEYTRSGSQPGAGGGVRQSSVPHNFRERQHPGDGTHGYAAPSRRSGGYKATQAGKGPHRLGSQQVVSVRGRRVNPVKRVTTRARLSVLAIMMMIGGIVFAIWLSGIATQQTFRVQVLTAEESQLNNELETLHRDLENVRSAAEVAGHAVAEGMQIPVEPGILRREENGDIVEDRPASSETRPIIDVNGEPVRPGQASSDPDGIGELRDRLESIPEGRRGIPYPHAGGPRAPESAASEVGERPASAPEGAEVSPSPAPHAGEPGSVDSEPAGPAANPDAVAPQNNQVPLQAPYQPNLR